MSRELFGAERETSEVVAWNELVLQTWRDLVRGGLKEDQRNTLIKKYSPPAELDFLRAPRLNAECRSALKNNSVLKRDEHSCTNQDQVGVALFAFGEAISDFLRSETQKPLTPEIRLAVSKVHEGAKILADLFYHLSLSRRHKLSLPLTCWQRVLLRRFQQILYCSDPLLERRLKRLPLWKSRLRI